MLENTRQKVLSTNERITTLHAERDVYKRQDGFHIHLDDLYGINAEGKSILIRREEQSKP